MQWKEKEQEIEMQSKVTAAGLSGTGSGSTFNVLAEFCCCLRVWKLADRIDVIVEIRNSHFRADCGP